MTTRLKLHQLDDGGAADSQGMVWDDSLKMWLPGDVVRTIIPATGVTVDDTDPANVVIGLTSGGATAPPLDPGFRTGEYYSNPFASGSATLTLTAGLLELVPFPVARTKSFDQMAAEVTALNASGRVRLGIYQSNSSGNPDALLLDAGTVNAVATGQRTLSISQSLTAGLYWIAALAEVAGGTWRYWAAASGGPPNLGFIVGTGSAGRLFATGVASGSLPSTAPALALGGATSGGSLRVLLRAT